MKVERQCGRRAGLRAARAIALVVLAAALTAAAAETMHALSPEELVGRNVSVPPDLQLDLEWYAPAVRGDAGRIVRGWVRADLVLLLTDRHNLIAVRRSDGTERWRCLLEDAPMLEPTVSRNNIILCVKNYLTAIEKRTGDVRWRLLPREALSSPPVVIDPVVYPQTYTHQWHPLEEVYAGTWNHRLQGMRIHARTMTYPGARGLDPLVVPEFTIFYTWQKTLTAERTVITATPRLIEDTLYYVASDLKVHAVSTRGDEREPYRMQQAPCTALTVTPASCYVGARDCFLYCLDRYTLKKKWFYAPGVPCTGTIYADEAPERVPYVFPVVEGDGVHALRIQPAEAQTKSSLGTPEGFQFAWKTPKMDGVIVGGERRVYLGAGLTENFRGYQKIAAVDKATGRVEWRSDSQGVRFYIEWHNAQGQPEQTMRLFAVAEDNRLLSFKERSSAVGPVAEAKPTKAARPEEAPKAPVPAGKAAEPPPGEAKVPEKAAPPPEVPKVPEKAAPPAEVPKVPEKAAPPTEAPKVPEKAAPPAEVPKVPEKAAPPTEAPKVGEKKAPPPKAEPKKEEPPKTE